MSAQSEWDRPGKLRIDAHRFPSGAWRMVSPDYTGLIVVGADIAQALQAFTAALVERFPERAGTEADVIIREVDEDGKPMVNGAPPDAFWAES